MKQKKTRICVTLRPILIEEAKHWAALRGLSLSAYITDCLLWQISHDRRRVEEGTGVYKEARK